MPQTAPVLDLPEPPLVEWHGGQRWVRAAPGDGARACARWPRAPAATPRCSRRRRDRPAPATGRFAPLAPPLDRIHRELKRQFDPAGIFNRAACTPTSEAAACRPISSPEFKDTPDGREAEAILRKCVHCGFCTATCPTYQILGDELDGPRGRIYLIKQVLEGETPTRKTQLHLDRCLTCRNCETHLPQRRASTATWSTSAGSIVDEKVPRGARAKALRWSAEGGPAVRRCSGRR